VTVTIRLNPHAHHVKSIDLPTTHGLVLMFLAPASRSPEQRPQEAQTALTSSLDATDDEEITWEDAEWR
jgi:hypothetical protein